MEDDTRADELQRQVLQSTLEEVARRDEQAADCCVICLEAISESCEARPCGHRNFDYLCIASWLYETPRCPLCKAPVLKLVHGPADNIQTTLFNQESKQSNSTNRASDTGVPRGRRHGFAARRPRPRHTFREATRPQNIASQRRDIYRRNLYSKHVGSNRMSRYRELSPHMFCADSELVSRARMWIRRELQVFSFLNLDDSDTEAAGPRTSDSNTPIQRRRANNAEFLLEYIVAILKSVDIVGSGGQAEEMLSDFLGRDNTKLFLHELRAWLRSPYTKLEDWDRAVQYDHAAGQGSTAPRHTHASHQGNGSNQSSDFSRVDRPKGDFYRPARTSSGVRRRHMRYEPYRDAGHGGSRRR
ncbi:hypothetical protein S40293_04740 [Stachybotrys chartarum IBT 40293]|nr:hypothetical protein S40293_04740 [Stachybotrys chartarum IBT 40293]